MSETAQETPSPEQRVFGSVFSLGSGQSEDSEAVTAFFRQRLEAMEKGEPVWLPRTLDGEGGIAADLRDKQTIFATLDIDYDGAAVSVYVTSEGGNFGDTALVDGVSFDEAVQAAEAYVDQQAEN